MIPLFLLRLIAGLAVTWCVLPRRQITSGFFRIQMLVTLGLSVLAFLMLGAGSAEEGAPGLWEQTFARGVLLLLAVGSFLGSVLWTLERRHSAFIVTVMVAVVSAGLLATVEAVSPHPKCLGIASGLSAAWLVGGVLCAMLLGHWYLTATGMPLAPLQTAIRLAIVASAVRIAIVGLAVVLADPEVQRSLVSSHLVWTLLRGLAGLFAPLALNVMALRTLLYRNTQAATGVLFAASVLVFIGESAALLLTSELKWPL